MSYDQMLSPLFSAGRSAWTPATQYGGGGEAVTRQILKCTRWQLEETTDFVTCPYHYYCDSSYPGDYSAAVGVLVAAFAAYCFLSTLAFTVLDLVRGNGPAAGVRGIKRKYLLPSGPFLLPLVLLALARGQRVNAVFPLAQLGPALLLLLQASALAFRNDADGDIRYAVLEASTVSGVLHASLYLDAVVLPYYTGLEALRWSRFSGECASCLCRMEPLVVGGTAVQYRGLSKTALAIIFALCSRMVCRIYGEERLSAWTRSALEAVGWVFVAADAVYLVGWVAAEGGAVGVAAYSLVAGLVFLSVFGKVYRFLAWVEARQSQWKSSLCHSIPSALGDGIFTYRGPVRQKKKKKPEITHFGWAGPGSGLNPTGLPALDLRNRGRHASHTRSASSLLRRVAAELEQQRRRRIDGGVGQGDEEHGGGDPAAVDARGPAGRRGLAAAAQGGVPRAHRLHVGEQGQGQRLVPHRRRQPGGHPLGGHLLVRPQPPPLRVPAPVRHPRRLPPGRPRDRAPHPRWQDPQDVPRWEDLPHRALQAAVGQELPEVRYRARAVPRPRAVARGGGPDSGRLRHGEAQG